MDDKEDIQFRKKESGRKSLKNEKTNKKHMGDKEALFYPKENT